ncbi:MAG: ThiF family adenylyltransferase [Aquidulcibacter sp.]|jgi:hypothetical protein|nr:ThiF family adenylyltransferase [Aquidulcibacter sp.]
MLRTLANHNDDLKRLIEKGYAVSLDGNYLVVRDIPYLDQSRALQSGAIVTQLEFVDGVNVRQQNHQVSFAGSEPFGLNGLPIPNLGSTTHNLILSAASSDVVVQRQFSNKPQNGYLDFFDKIERYTAIISGPAIALHAASPLTFRTFEDGAAETPFKLRDTMSTRAEILDLSNLFRNEVVAIIGLGGTGAYVLDFMVKVPVKEILAFDGDCFQVHTTFRSPGKMVDTELGRSKASVYESRYAEFRKGMVFYNEFFDASCAEKLEGVTFAFVCVDLGPARAEIIEVLISLGIPFVDVGMGLNRKNGPINGTLRTTLFSKDFGSMVQAERLVPTHEAPEDIYVANIQIAELNALNAAMAVIKYKKQIGFYSDKVPVYHSLLSLGELQLHGLSREI